MVVTMITAAASATIPITMDQTRSDRVSVDV
jgi:hypothetical protein